MPFSSNYPKALKDGTAGEGSASPSKTDNKKRGHVKDDPDAEGAAIDEPAPKKTKARTKKEPRIENDDANGEPENEDPKIKKSKPRVKKEPKIKNEDADGRSENEDPNLKKPKSRVKKEQKIKNEDADGGSENEDPKLKKPKSRVKKEQKIKNEDADTESENEGPANKKTKATGKKGKMANSNDADEDFEQEAQPVKKGRKQARKATAGGETALNVKEESGDPNTLPPPKGKRQRAPRKAATARKIKDEDTETDGLISAPELGTPPGKEKPEHTSELEPEASEQVPKLQKGKKGAPRKVIDRPAEKAEKKVVSKVRMLIASLIAI